MRFSICVEMLFPELAFLEKVRRTAGLGFEIVREVDRPWLRLLYDVYHMQIMEGNVIATLRENADLLGYIHVADVPNRGEPGTGELNIPNIHRALAGVGYDGTVGFEFMPTGSSESALEAVGQCIASV